MLMLRALALWILGSSLSSELVRVAPRRFLKWSGQFFFLSDLEPPFIRIDGLLFRSVRSLIVSYAETCRWTAFFRRHSVDFALDIFCFSIGIGFVKLSLCLADVPKRGLWWFILMLFSGGDDVQSFVLP